MYLWILLPKIETLIYTEYVCHKVAVWNGFVQRIGSVGPVQRNYSTSDPIITGIGDLLRAGKPRRYVTSHPGQLSLPSFRGSLVEYQ